MAVRLTVCQNSVAAEAFAAEAAKTIGGPMRAISIRTVQLNVGLQCNLTCEHCHVEASPDRDESMRWETMNLAIDIARKMRVASLDITGGEPVLHPHFRRLVEAARAAELQVMVRTNLVSLLKKTPDDLLDFLKLHRVRLVGSLPSYEASVVDEQRGVGVFAASIESIRRLNAIGYGIEATLPLDLVHNPHGPLLPPAQSSLERDFKHQLDKRHGLRFTQLFIFTNMPLGRFGKQLQKTGKFDLYVNKLRSAYNPDTLEGLSCRHQLHVAWDGALHDCDFHCAAGMAVSADTPGNIKDFDPTTYLQRRICSAEHCWGCTAGRGSSWGGELV